MTKPSPASTLAVSKLASFVAVLSLSMPTVGACSRANSNPLIGSWQFSSTTSTYGAAGCSSAFVFTAERATITDAPSNAISAGSVRTLVVRYVPSPTLVTVMTNGNDVNYTMVDNSHMYTESPYGKCYYRRMS